MHSVYSGPEKSWVWRKDFLRAIVWRLHTPRWIDKLFTGSSCFIPLMSFWEPASQLRRLSSLHSRNHFVAKYNIWGLRCPHVTFSTKKPYKCRNVKFVGEKSEKKCCTCKKQANKQKQISILLNLLWICAAQPDLGAKICFPQKKQEPCFHNSKKEQNNEVGLAVPEDMLLQHNKYLRVHLLPLAHRELTPERC